MMIQSSDVVLAIKQYRNPIGVTADHMTLQLELHFIMDTNQVLQLLYGENHLQPDICALFNRIGRHEKRLDDCESRLKRLETAH